MKNDHVSVIQNKDASLSITQDQSLRVKVDLDRLYGSLSSEIPYNERETQIACKKYITELVNKDLAA